MVMLTLLGVLVVLANGVNSSTFAETTEPPLRCPPPMAAPSSDDQLPKTVVFLEHKKWSLTNFEPWGPYTYKIGMFRFNTSNATHTTELEVSKSKTITVAISMNETHVCAASDYILIKDTSSMYSGDYNKTTICNTICFPSNEYQERHTIQVFKSFTDGGYPIGQWEEFDSISVYSSEDKEVQCYYRNDSFSFHPEYDDPDFDDVYTEIKKCPVGQVCRITRARRTYSTSAYLFIGCELDDDQFSGCAEACDYYEFQGNYRWDITCRFCCKGDLCNSPTKCTKKTCDLSGSEPNNQRKSGNAAQYHAPFQFLMMLMLSCSRMFSIYDYQYANEM